MRYKKYPRGVSEFTDRHGKVRIRGRRAGWKTYWFKHAPPSEEFELELRNWQAGAAKRPEVGAERVRAGSMSALIVRYYRSVEFVTLAKSTQATYRGIIEQFRVEHGERTVAGLQRKQIKGLVAKRAGTPAAANNLLRMLRILMKFAVDMDMRPDDPTVGIKPVANKTDGFHSWSEDEIGAFESAHPIGSRARLAFALLLYTGQRRSDVIKMGRQHLRGNRIMVRQQKTGVQLEIPIHPELARIIAATPSDNLTFLVTKAHRANRSKPFTAAGFGNWFREMCDDAGLPQCSAHGLRKAVARRLAEAGCSEHVIAAITGHRSLHEVRRYTASASQVLLAQQAIQAMPGSKDEQKLANPTDRLAKSSAKRLK
jgi:integrase